MKTTRPRTRGRAAKSPLPSGSEWTVEAIDRCADVGEEPVDVCDHRVHEVV